ncbi:MAG: hypothetical protein FJ098_00835 [Deltaproteobacteria bacterium]|nr:hypothetical protein [Deltaproteobacteria bacterium]
MGRTAAGSRLFLVMALTLAACDGGGTGDEGPAADTDDVAAPGDAAGPPDVGAGDPEVSDAGAAADLELRPEPPPDLPPEFSCAPMESLTSCGTVGPAPGDPAANAQWVGTNAVPLRCTDGAGEHWDFDIFADGFQDRALFCMGEVHGSMEIGPASADLMEALVRGAGVDTLALEMGMDLSEALDAYVESGDESLLDDGLFWGQYTDVMFRKALPRRARAIFEDTGLRVRLVAVDTPQRLAWVNERITEVAGTLDAQAASLLLDVLPPAQEPPYGNWGMGLDTAYVNLTKNYHQHVVDHRDVICAELANEACEDLEFLAWALYTGARFNSSDFTAAMMGRGNPLELMTWMTEREELLEHNFRRAMPDGTRLYAHMGAAHCAKGGWNVAGLLDSAHPPAQGRVYSVTPAYGAGSKIFYGYSAQAVPPEPAAAASSLAQLPLENYFLATAHPGVDCSANPFADEVAARVGGAYGVAYDAFFWFRTLTPEQSGWWKPRRAWETVGVQDPAERLRFADEVLARLSCRAGSSR